MRRIPLLALVSFAVSACISVSSPAPSPATAPAAAPGSAPEAATVPETEERNPADHRLLYATLWMQTAAEYDALALQAFAAARAAVDRALDDPSWTSAVEQPVAPAGAPAAVIVDIDETVLDNTPFEARLIRENVTYTEERWAQWVEERAALPVPGALEFARHVAARGVTVFYVTNRDTAGELATRENLRAAGFPIDRTVDVVLVRGERDWTTSDKTARREWIAAKYRILALVGDDLGDFLPNVRVSPADREEMVRRHRDRWGRSWFVIPNPAYGSWERALVEGAEDRDARLLDSLRVQ